MAKSLRSKRGKSMRRIKRVRYAAKELQKLKETVKTLGVDVVMESLPGTANPIDVTSAAKGSQDASGDVEMASKSKYDPKTFRDDNGQYPVWYNKRKVKKQKVKQIKKLSHDPAVSKQQKRNLKRKMAKSKRKKGSEW